MSDTVQVSRLNREWDEEKKREKGRLFGFGAEKKEVISKENTVSENEERETAVYRLAAHTFVVILRFFTFWLAPLAISSAPRRRRRRRWHSLSIFASRARSPLHGAAYLNADSRHRRRRSLFNIQINARGQWLCWLAPDTRIRNAMRILYRIASCIPYRIMTYATCVEKIIIPELWRGAGARVQRRGAG